MVPFPDHLQALQRQVFIVNLEIARPFDNHVGLAAGGDGFRRRSKLVDGTFENAIDHAQGAVIESALYARDGGGADYIFGPAEFHLRKAGSPAEEGVNGNADADGYGAAEVLALSRDAIEINRCAHIDDHAGTAVFIKAGNTVDEPVRADLVGVVVQNLETDIGLGTDEHRVGVEVAPRHVGKRGIDRR